MNIVRYPTTGGSWAATIFAQSTVFSFGEKELSLAALFESPDLEPYHLRGLEKAWESATAAAFINRSLAGEELIEKILTAINTTIKESSISLQGAILLTEDLRVHFSTVGETEVILSDSNSTTCVSAVQRGQEFTAVTSGEVEDGDVLVLAPSFIAQEIRQRSVITPELLEEVCTNERTTLIVASNQSIQPVAEIHNNNSEKAAQGQRAISEGVNNLIQKIGSVLGRIRLPRLHKFRLKVPTKLPKFKFRIGSLNRPVTIIALLIFIGGIYFASTVVADRMKFAKQTEQPPKTALTILKETSTADTLKYLERDFEFASYQSLTDSEKTEFKEVLSQRSIEPISTTVKQTLPEKIRDISAVGNVNFILDASGQLWRFDTTLRKVEQSGLIVDPQRVLAIKEDRILVTDKAGNIWLYDGAATQPISLPLPQSLSGGTKLLAKYNNNIYIYSAETKIISRISGFDRDIASPTTYANVGTIGLGILRDLAITGDALALDTSGKIKIFSRTTSLKEVVTAASETARIVPLSNGLLHINNRLMTTYSADLAVVKTSFLLVQELPEAALQQSDKLSIIGAGNTLYAVNN